MSANPAANGGRLSIALDLPDFTDYAFEVPVPGQELQESTRRMGEWLRDVFTRNAADRNFRLFCPDETNSNRLGAVFEVEDRCWTLPITDDDDHLSPTGRVMEVLSEHLCHGWLEGYTLTGRRGLFATYEAFAMVSASMTVQHTKWLDASDDLGWRRPVPSLNVLLTSTCWRNDHNGFSHQGPGLIDTVVSKKPDVARVYLPPDGNTLLSVTDHCLRSTNYVNLIVIDKQPQLQWLDMRAAREHCTRGYGPWAWAGTFGGDDPDVVLACAGDVVTMETVAASELLRRMVPDLRVRLVNVVDLMTLLSANDHPHGMDLVSFNELFTPDRDVVFAFHGYARGIHFLIHGQGDTDRFHVRGYREEGTTTTPFDMVVRNEVSRYHLCLEALRRSRVRPPGSEALAAEWRERWGVRVYDFHGLSHAYASRRAADLVGRTLEKLRVVTCHLGAGASLAAVYDGRSVATTMGFTPMAGLPMATRSGDVDPGALLCLQTQTGLTPAEMNEVLLHGSGLAGLSGRSGDVWEVLSGMTEGDPACTLAWQVYNFRLRQGISAMVVPGTCSTSSSSPVG